MRVIAGAAKGRRLSAPPGESTRPTADRVKEALFSSLMPRLAAAHVLDLYAGSGALGIEALSRGAARATFVERAGRAVEALEHNLELTDLVGSAVVVARDVDDALAGPVRGAPFDIVLLDPPYRIASDELSSVLAALVPHLADRAIVVVELGRHSAPPVWPEALLSGRSRRYGDTVLYEATFDGRPGS